MLQYDPRLVEEAVLLAADDASPTERARFRKERDAVYGITEARARESAFRELDARWFARFQIAQPLQAALREHPSIDVRLRQGFGETSPSDFALRASSSLAEAKQRRKAPCGRRVRGAVSKCVVLEAHSTKDEGADLHESREAGSPPALVIRLRPQTLLASERLFPLLRRELLHVADMLDPRFGYERALPAFAGGPTYENIIRARYRVVWNTTVDGRLVAQGRLPPSAEEQSFRQFQATFGSLCSDPRKHFDELFRNRHPRHRAIVSFAISPGSPDAAAATARGACPLCQLPAMRLVERLSPEIASILRNEYPDRDLKIGICRQCLDLYEAQLTLRER